jgi:hypothetical protein
MLYFFDTYGRYIGCRARLIGESVPASATETPVDVPDGNEAYYFNGAWEVKECAQSPEEIVCQVPTEAECNRQLITQVNADFVAFMDYFFTMFPEE